MPTKQGCLCPVNPRLEHYLLYYKTNYLYQEVNCTEPPPLVKIPWQRFFYFKINHQEALTAKQFNLSNKLVPLATYVVPRILQFINVVPVPP